MSTTGNNEEYCDLYSAPPPTASFGLEFQFPGLFITDALRSNMSKIRGAGGLSIGPILEFNAVQLVAKDARSLKLISDLHKHEILTETTVIETLLRLSELFLSLEASPKDVDSDGCSLFYVRMKLHDRFVFSNVALKHACTLSQSVSQRGDIIEIGALRMLLRGLWSFGAPLNHPWLTDFM